jgi:hypothetical protein
MRSMPRLLLVCPSACTTPVAQNLPEPLLFLRAALSCRAVQPVEVYSEVYPTTAFPTFEDCLQVITAMM